MLNASSWKSVLFFFHFQAFGSIVLYLDFKDCYPYEKESRIFLVKIVQNLINLSFFSERCILSYKISVLTDSIEIGWIYFVFEDFIYGFKFFKLILRVTTYAILFYVERFTDGKGPINKILKKSLVFIINMSWLQKCWSK